MLLDDARAAGEPVAALWASEGAIYGRYGFGPATRAMRYELQLDRVALRRDVALPAAPPQVGGARRCARADPPAVRPRAGRAARDARPARRVVGPAHPRPRAPARRRRPLRAAVQPGPDGEAAGYALFAAKMSWGDDGPAGSVAVEEIVAETPEAHAGLWRLLLGLDLVRTLQWRLAPEQDALPHLLASNDAVDRRAGDGLFVRLVDVDAALAARSYAIPVDLVLEVDDPFCPWNTGRHRLHDGGCEPTGAPGRPGARRRGAGRDLPRRHPGRRARRGRPVRRAAAGCARRGRDGVPRRRRAVVSRDLLSRRL